MSRFRRPRSFARDKLDGPEDVDQGIRGDGKANIVPSTPDAIAFTRTPEQVLHIVYLTDQDGVSKGGFYPRHERQHQQHVRIPCWSRTAADSLVPKIIMPRNYEAAKPFGVRV